MWPLLPLTTGSASGATSDWIYSLNANPRGCAEDAGDSMTRFHVQIWVFGQRGLQHIPTAKGEEPFFHLFFQVWLDRCLMLLSESRALGREANTLTSGMSCSKYGAALSLLSQSSEDNKEGGQNECSPPGPPLKSLKAKYWFWVTLLQLSFTLLIFLFPCRFLTPFVF